MLSKNFADVNAIAYTPQQRLNRFIAASLSGVNMADVKPVRYATVLRKIKGDMDAVLFGKELDGEVLKIRDSLTEQLIRSEANVIQAVIDTACFTAQGRALEDIFTHGSLSSARLFGVSFARAKSLEGLDL